MLGKFGYQATRAAQNSVDAVTKSMENVSNMYSLGYKKSQASFVETLSGEIEKKETRDFSQGALRKTGEVYDLALEGPGFFEVEMQNGQRAYTRVGKFSLTSEGELVTDEGYKVIPENESSGKPVLEIATNDSNELVNIKVTTQKLTIPTNLTPQVDEDGTVYGLNAVTGEKAKIGKINVVAFNNSQGLESLGRSCYLPTKSSGPALDIETGPSGNTRVKQGFIEFSNVTMAQEFMNMSQLKNLLAAQFKVLKIMDKIYENVHYTISRST